MQTDGRPMRMLDQVREHYPVVMHGVSLSIGSSDPLDMKYLQQLKDLANRVQPAWISDHLCWTGINGKNSHDLLPLPYTNQALQHITDRIKQVQDFLGRPILLENPSSYLTFKESTIPEHEFIAQMAEIGDCALLLDVNNVFVSSFNHRLDAYEYIDAMPADRVVQVHLAGHHHKGNHIVDTHDDHVTDEVWELYKHTLTRTGDVATMVEWDANIPDFKVLQAEVDKARRFSFDLRSSAAQAARLNGASPRFTRPPHSSVIANDHKSYNRNFEQVLSPLQQAMLSGDIPSVHPDNWVQEKHEFSPTEQLEVYVNGYRYRLYDIVAEDYDATRTRIGDEKFAQLLKQYIEDTPSVSFNLAVYTQNFADYLARQNIDDVAKQLATLEKTILEVFAMPETNAFDIASYAQLSIEEFIELPFRLRSAHEFLQFKCNINEYFRAVMFEEELPEIIEQEQHILIYRHEDIVRRMALEPEEARILQAIASGSNIGEATEALLEDVNIDIAKISANLQAWFKKWVEQGLFSKP